MSLKITASKCQLRVCDNLSKSLKSILLFIALLNEDLVEFTTLRCETTTTVLTWFDFSVVFLLRVSFTLTGETRFSQSLLLTFVSGGLTRISDSSLGRASGWGTMTKSHSLNSQRLWDFFIMIVWIAVESIYADTKVNLQQASKPALFFSVLQSSANYYFPVSFILSKIFVSGHFIVILHNNFLSIFFSDGGLRDNIWPFSQNYMYIL